MQISLAEVKPYLRYVRTVTVTPEGGFPPSAAYDARLFYTLEGAGTVEADGTAYPMKPGCLLLLNGGVPYWLQAPERRVSYLAVNFDYTYRSCGRKGPVAPDPTSSFRPENRIDPVTFADAPQLDRVLYLEGMDPLTARLQAMEGEYTRKINLYEWKLSTGMADVLIRCLRQAALHRAEAEGAALAGRIVGYLQAHLDRNLTNRDIAAVFHYHPNYISGLMKAYTGQPLHRYLKHLRIAKAEVLLVSGGGSLDDIARACGFCDASHLIKCFRAEVGMTPSEFRLAGQ